VFGLGDHLEVGFGVRHGPEPGADDRVVVRDEDPRHERDRHQLASAGTSRRISTPRAGPGLTASAPPTSTARSRMPRRPPRPSWEADAFIPRPSSTTRRTTLFAPGSSVSSTRLASAWRATF